MIWHCADESGVVVQIEADTSTEAAQEYVDGGDWSEEDRTVFHTISAWRLDEDGDEIDQARITITVDPPEPPCGEDPTDGHDWRERFLQGHGGGVIVIYRCAGCGLDCHTDTWATNPGTGEQGFTSVQYKTAADREAGL